VFVEVVELGAVHGVTSTPSRGNSEYDTCPGIARTAPDRCERHRDNALNSSDHTLARTRYPSICADIVASAIRAYGFVPAAMEPAGGARCLGVVSKTSDNVPL
jgi:hypothetical protein